MSSPTSLSSQNSSGTVYYSTTSSPKDSDLVAINSKSAKLIDWVINKRNEALEDVDYDESICNQLYTRGVQVLTAVGLLLSIIPTQIEAGIRFIPVAIDAVRVALGFLIEKHQVPTYQEYLSDSVREFKDQYRALGYALSAFRQNGNREENIYSVTEMDSERRSKIMQAESEAAKMAFANPKPQMGTTKQVGAIQQDSQEERK